MSDSADVEHRVHGAQSTRALRERERRIALDQQHGGREPERPNSRHAKKRNGLFVVFGSPEIERDRDLG